MDYESYWQGFKTLWEQNKKDIYDYDPIVTDRQYLDFRFGTSHAHFALNAPKKEIRCELVLDDEEKRESVLKELERREDEIEESLKMRVVISHLYAERRLYVVRQDLHPMDGRTVHEQYGWMLDKLKLFYGYFPGLLDEIMKG